ncbi:MAG: hypothetical protein A2X86_09605 [Bdellovibrionales bacterium GWA2_49_15]|nr:MAG: hypothetical protein A2X86_09605 [Bdellovibrionales bacterium GWA2_49_15]HAZ13035.1 hypothetical protein [Bdellovibrionales bacterium]
MLFRFLLMVSVCYASTAYAEMIAYQKHELGSLSNDTPLSYYMNATFDTVQNPDYFSQKGIYKRHSLVWKRISKPHDNIKREGGYDKLINDEFLGIRAVPNYTLHLIGAGYDFRRMSEWYEAHEVSYPYAWGTATIIAAEFGNEALESSQRDIGAHDHIADMYFFDTAAKILFANDRIAKFMVDELQMTVWNFRPMYFPADHEIHNAGTNYILRPRYLSTEKTSPLIHMGLMPMLGVSRRLPEQFRLSVGMGPSIRNPMTQEGMLGGGFFVEKNDELMASIYVNASEHYRVRLNLYPGALGLYNKYTNIFMAIERNNTMAMGVDFNLPFGLMGKI